MPRAAIEWYGPDRPKYLGKGPDLALVDAFPMVLAFTVTECTQAESRSYVVKAVSWLVADADQ